MKLSHNIWFYIGTKGARFDCLSILGLHNHLSDERFIKKCYKAHTGDDLDLENPHTFTEKLQWLKLYDHKPKYTIMVDKYEGKKYVDSILGKGHTIPLLGVWNHFDDIDFSTLPNQFVLKCTHDSASYIICKDKFAFNKKDAKSKLERRLKKSFFDRGREWPYKNVKPRIIAEKFMVEDPNVRGLTDYKFFCFNGEPKVMYIGHDIADNPVCDFYDANFNRVDLRSRDPISGIDIEKPVFFDQMLEYARILSKGIPHVRVDFYYIDNTIYFGEFTFFHNGGMIKIQPEEWNLKLGDWITLPKVAE